MLRTKVGTGGHDFSSRFMIPMSLVWMPWLFKSLVGEQPERSLKEQLVSPLSGLELAQFLEGGADHPVSFSRLYWVDPWLKALIPFLLVLGVPSLTGNFMYQNNLKKKLLNALLLKNDLYLFIFKYTYWN